MVDFHTHILPKMDDGSRSLEETKEIIDRQKESSVHAIIATPHFAKGDGLEQFLEKRQNLYRQVENLEYAIYLGAEVALTREVPKMKNLRALAIEGTDYLLLKLPRKGWEKWVYEAIEAIIQDHKLIPIIAHIECYTQLEEDLEPLNQLIQLGVLFQVNTHSLNPKSTKRKLIKMLIKRKLVHVIGSNVHHTKDFISIKQGLDWIEQFYGKGYVVYINQVSEDILIGKRMYSQMNQPFKKVLGKWI